MTDTAEQSLDWPHRLAKLPLLGILDFHALVARAQGYADDQHWPSMEQAIATQIGPTSFKSEHKVLGTEAALAIAARHLHHAWFNGAAEK